MDAGTCKQYEFAVALCRCGLWSLATSIILAFYAQDVVLDEVRGSGFTAHDRKVLEIMDFRMIFLHDSSVSKTGRIEMFQRLQKFPVRHFLRLDFSCDAILNEQEMRSNPPYPSRPQTCVSPTTFDEKFWGMSVVIVYPIRMVSI